MAVMLTEEQFAAMMRQLGGRGGAGGGGGGSRRKRLDMKYLRVPEFSGGMGDWSDWAFAFRRAVRQADRSCFDIMEEVEKEKDEIKEEDLTDEEMEDGNVGDISAELYDLLCTTVKGEALTIMKTVEEFCGFKAWQRLYAKYNPKTTARAIKLLAEVCSPGAVKGLHEVETAISNWKNKVKILEKEFDEKLGERMRIAILTSMLPTSIQDHVFQTVSDSTTFDALVAKVSAWVSNKVAMEGTPMDIGEVGEQEWEEEDVAAVSAWTRCNNCSGYGHIARECPSKGGKGNGNKGTGKGDYGKGIGYKGGGKGDYGKNGGYKGYGKGDYGKNGGYKGYGKGEPKGGGKGYQGTCYNCGKVGHKAAECRGVHAVEEEQQPKQEAVVEEVSLGGGVWMIGAVEAEEFQKAVRTTRARRCEEPPGLVVHNKFGNLLNDDCHDDEADNEPDTSDGWRNAGARRVAEEGPVMAGTGLCGGHDTSSRNEYHKCGKVLCGGCVGGSRSWPPKRGTRVKVSPPCGHVQEGSSGPSIGDFAKYLEEMTKCYDKCGEFMRNGGIKEYARNPPGALPGACSAIECHDDFVDVHAVGVAPVNRKAAMKFHVAAVQRPLASAVKVVQAGNRVVMARDGAYIQNEATGEKMPLRVERGTFVFDVEYCDGSPGTITLDSGAGVNVWPEHLLPAVPMSPPEPGLRMTAANGTEIPSRGMKVVEFRGRGSAQMPGGSRRA
jgi:hypothetical protein